LTNTQNHRLWMAIAVVLLITQASCTADRGSGFGRAASDAIAPFLAVGELAMFSDGVRGKQAAWQGAKALIATSAATTFLKYTVRERRPNSDSLASFPSGHTSAAFATATVIADYNHKYAVPAYGVATVIGWSRVDVGSHYWWDVVAGAVLGYAVAKQFTKTSLAFSPDGIRCAWTW